MRHSQAAWTERLDESRIALYRLMMSSYPIAGKEAALYLGNVVRHGLHEDTRWLIDVGRFPVGCRVVDAGCGSGTLVAALADDRRFARSVIGVELSPELAQHAASRLDGNSGSVVHADFLEWSPPVGWQPEALVMSFFLHHTEDFLPYLRRAAELLPHGGRLYVMDRIALDDSALRRFQRFWESHYRAEHEWKEAVPNLTTIAGLTDAARGAGFAFVERSVCPHDKRIGARKFPKTLMQFWRMDRGRRFLPILVVSPCHLAVVGEIVRELEISGLHVTKRLNVFYSNDFVRRIYQRCPWLEVLLDFISVSCPKRVATVLLIDGDSKGPAALSRLVNFKRTHRERWQSFVGRRGKNGVVPMILPFHVPEPYESEELAALVGLSV